MAGYNTAIGLTDKMSPVLKSIMNAMRSTMLVMEQMDKKGDVVGGRAFNAMKENIAAAEIEMLKLVEHTDSVAAKAQAAGQGFGSWGSRIGTAVTGIESAIRLVERGMRLVNDLAAGSDELVLIKSRLDLIGVSQKKIMDAAGASRGIYQDTADAVAKLGMMAGNAFASEYQLIRFSELVNKSFKIAGTDSAGAAGAMLQLTQGLAMGALRGQELNSVLQNGGLIAQYIADYLKVPKGSLKALAEEGKLTSDVIVKAMLAAGADIDRMFESMPQTFADVGNRIKREATNAFYPVSQQFSQIINSEAFEKIVTAIVDGLYYLAQFVSNVVMPVIQTAIDWIADNIQGVTTCLTILGVVAAVVAAVFAVSWAIANWPILLIIIGIWLLINVLEQLGVTSDQVLEFTGGLFGFWFAFIHNEFVRLYNLVISFVEFFANVWDDPLGSVARLFADVFDNILSFVQSIAGAIDFLTGSNLAAGIDKFRRAFKAAVADQYGEATIKYDRMGLMDVEDTIRKGINIAGTLKGFELPDTSGLFNGGSLGNIDKVGEVGKIKGEVSISEDDIKLLRDAALVDFRLNYRQITPSVTAHFGNVLKSADPAEIVEGLVEILTEAIDGGVYGD